MNDFEKLLRQLEKEVSELEQHAEDRGYGSYASKIGNTEFDMYRWTFTEGRTTHFDNWTIPIPDGFEMIFSFENRPFEAVPKGMEEEHPANIQVRILPGQQTELKQISGEGWHFHPYARTGIVSAYAVFNAKILNAMFHKPPEPIAVVTDDVSASLLVQDTSNGSYAFQCNFLTEGIIRAFRIQTAFITPRQKETLTASVIEWMEMFRFDERSPAIPQKSKLEEHDVFENLKKGNTDRFDKAIEYAQGEWTAAVKGQFTILNYLAENDMLDDTAADQMQEYLTQGEEVIAYYCRQADQLLDRAIAEKLPSKTIIHMYQRLEQLQPGIEYAELDDERIYGITPIDIQNIRTKWATTIKQLK